MMKISKKYYLYLILSSLCMTLTFSPVNAWYLGFIGLIPLIHVLFTRTDKSFFKGYLFGFFYSLVLVHWLAFNSGAQVWLVTLSAIAAAAFVALNYGIIAWLSVLLIKRDKVLGLIAFPFIWTSVEFLRSYGVLGFQWVLAANGQTGNLAYIQLADAGGPYLITFLLVSINTLLFALIRQIPKRRSSRILLWVIFAIFLILPYSYGIYRLFQTVEGDKAYVFRIIQPDFDSHEKWERERRSEVFSVMDELSRAPGVDTVDIIIWPESATPVYIRTQIKYRRLLENLTRETGKVLISGVPDYFIKDNNVNVTNSMFVFEPGEGITSKYNKQTLVPFGEYIPFSNIFPILSRLNLGQGNFTPGKDEPLLHIRSLDLTLAPMICYESVFSTDAIKKIRHGGQFHILATNDSWFGNSWGPYQHAAQSVYRAVETRRPVLRSANTGISMVINSKGQILNEIPLGTRGFIDVSVPLLKEKSLYVRSGNAFALIILGIAFGMFLTPFWPVKAGGKREQGR
ncbi:MAG TPA: apolipoprotein N-acyltransferase [Candidatus Marinimicrobia bacterium]|nr:apolipoprotein N-acyltransferase [Candidatus Neomarinimicrobiota bacterium]